ncbi:hypothetical protein FN846DRAFT_889367 [Sphaerosporella brunnea]|uniref:Uncharacterized protein n=1 Tax=Sphaerosporella brunnea TaxID=1250544 RepID=A0A5J5EZE8_9PEZI|nr:hypothetical protein FN846DRAFT_889367 [Sphaerosporella brunnea]
MSAVPGSSGFGIEHRHGQRAAAPSPADHEDDVMQAFYKKISGQWRKYDARSSKNSRQFLRPDAFYEAVGSRTLSGQRSSHYIAFLHKRRTANLYNAIVFEAIL